MLLFMVRKIPQRRIADLIDVAAETFIALGYRRTQMSDVAEALGVAKGSLYTYVESKEALFDTVIRFADGESPLPDPDALPFKTPPGGATLEYLQERMTREAGRLKLLQIVSPGHPSGDVAAELEEILVDLYRLVSRNRRAIKMVDRCALEHPELADLWFSQGRWAQHGLLVEYLERAVRAGALRPLPDVAIAARHLLETVVFWAVHRHWDPSPQDIVETEVETVIVRLLLHGIF